MNSTLHIPKAEIHVHLEATITPFLCRKFSERNKVAISEDIFGSEYAYQWEDFYDFIKRYDIVTSVIHTPEDYYELTYEYLKECASHNVLYVEAMVSSTHAKAKGMSYHSFIEGVYEASKKAEEDFGIVSRYIMNGIRHLGPDSVENTAKEVLDNPHPCLVGFGLAGDELHFPPHLFTKTFDMLKQESFPITVHAGEWDGPENIRNAIHLLHPTRLGHGVRSIEDVDFRSYLYLYWKILKYILSHPWEWQLVKRFAKVFLTIIRDVRNNLSEEKFNELDKKSWNTSSKWCHSRNPDKEYLAYPY